MDEKAKSTVTARGRFSPARWFAALGAALVLFATSGCTLYVTSTAKWVGHSRDELTRQWGEGLETASGAADGSTIVQYDDLTLIVVNAPLTGLSKEVVVTHTPSPAGSSAPPITTIALQDRFPPTPTLPMPSGNFFWPCVTWFVVDSSGIIREAHVEPVTHERSVDACVWPKFAGAQVLSPDRSSPKGAALQGRARGP